MKANRWHGHYEWRFLPHYVIRSTGFPFEWIEQLSFQETSTWAAHMLVHERLLAAHLESLSSLEHQQQIRPLLRHIRKWATRPEVLMRQSLLQLPQFLELPTESQTVLIEWASAWDIQKAAYQAQLEEGRSLFAQELERKRQQLRRIVAHPLYQEALFLSSPDMYHHSVPKYQALPDEARRSSEIKRLEKRFFSYLQRFCGKNETTSFFGPLNYGQIDDAQESTLQVQMRQQGPLVQQREVFLSFWAVKALAGAIQNDIRLQHDVPLALHPMVEIKDDRVLYLHASGQSLTIGSGMLPLLSALDGKQSSRMLLATLPESEQAQAVHLLARLIQVGIIRREIHVPSSAAHPLRAVCEQLRRFPVSPARQQWLERLEGWQRWCDEMAGASLDTRIRLLEQGETWFTAQTGKPARRGDGSLYADRLIFYEETQGHVTHFIMGRALHEHILHRLRGALELSAVQGYREWQHAQACGRTLFSELSPLGEPISFYRFIEALTTRYPTFPQMPSTPEQRAIEHLIASKMSQGEDRCVSLCSEELPIQEHQAEFYSLPDLFFAAPDVQALQRNDFQLVVGKLHSHLLVPGWLSCLYPAEEQLREDISRYLAEVPAFRYLACPEILRRNKGFYTFPGRMITFSEHSLKPQEQVIPLYDLHVVSRPDGMLGLERISSGEPVVLYLSLADQVRYLPFAMFALPGLSHLSLSLGRHTPRIEIDNAVYQRERWEIVSAEWQAHLHADDLTNFTRLQECKQAHNLPDWVYIRGSAERKPYLCDFRNFFCLELLQTILARNSSLIIEEMLPTPADLWLKSDEGRYSCEFRMNVFKLCSAERGTP